MPGRRARETPAKPPIITAITVAPKAAMNELRIASPTPAKSKMPRYESVSAPLMMQAAKKMAFEEAAALRQKIFYQKCV